MYLPKPPPFNPDAETLSRYVDDELQSVARSQGDAVDFVQFNVLHAAPRRPREGLVACADGADWAPGVGAGLYIYISGAWTKL